MYVIFAARAVVAGSNEAVDRLHRTILAAHAHRRDETLRHWSVPTGSGGQSLRRYAAACDRYEPSLSGALLNLGERFERDVCVLLTSQDEFDGSTLCIERGRIIGLEPQTEGQSTGDLEHWHAAAAFDHWCRNRGIHGVRGQPGVARPQEDATWSCDGVAATSESRFPSLRASIQSLR